MRSQYIVAGGTGLYENPGLVGMVYVYSKGFEVLTLPLCDLASHSYLTFFNLWLAVLGIRAMVWNAVLLTGNRKQETEKNLTYHSVLPGIMAAVLTVSVPGIMNMALTAKADLITCCCSLLCWDVSFSIFMCMKIIGYSLSGAAGSYFLSLTMKPTSLVFSTAVFGMMGLYLLWFWFHERGAVADLFHHLVRLIGSLCLPFGALVGIRRGR